MTKNSTKKPYSAYINGRWYQIRVFYTMEACNQFLEANEDYGLLKEGKTYEDKPCYIVARNDDKGAEKLDLYYDGEEPGFCQTFYRAPCGQRLFCMIEGEGLYTCNDDAWREPECPVNAELFTLHNAQRKAS